MEEQNKTDDTKSLGIGKIFLGSIQVLLQQCDNCRRTGDYSGWRNNEDCIVGKFSGRIIPEEDAKLKNHTINMNKKFLEHSIRQAKGIKHNKGFASKRTIIAGKNLATELSEYQKTIIKILDRLDWLIPREKIRKRPQ